MKVTVNLDSQAVIAQPPQLRIKAGAFVPVAVAFTRASQTVALPAGTAIEFALKPRNVWTGGLLAYLNTFELSAGNLYVGSLNCASQCLLGALGLNDTTPLNDLPQLEASAEVTWSINGQKFRSATFPVVVEAPVTDDVPIPTPNPEVYPAPGTIALKSDLASVATTGDYNDLSNKPTLGSAASHDAGDFATAAQGAKADTAVQPGQLAPVAVSGSYGDLQGVPAIPEPQVSSDWNATLGVAQILNKPALGSASAQDATDFATAVQGEKADTAVQPAQLAAVATSGNYNDLEDKPVLGTASSHDAADFATAAQGEKADTAVQPEQIATVATSGNYNDLSDTPVLGTAAAQPSTAFDPSGAAGAAQSFAVQRANHTGTQPASTISDFAAAASNAVTWTTLLEKPVLGSAASQNVSAFATAAQGAKADAVAAVTGLVKAAGGTFSPAQAGSDYAYANVKIVSGTYNAVAGDLIADDRLALAVNLPSGPHDGDTVALVNATGFWAASTPGSVVINGNGIPISTLVQPSSSTNSISCDTNDYSAIRFVYSATLNQWIALPE